VGADVAQVVADGLGLGSEGGGGGRTTRCSRSSKSMKATVVAVVEQAGGLVQRDPALARGGLAAEHVDGAGIEQARTVGAREQGGWSASVLPARASVEVDGRPAGACITPVGDVAVGELVLEAAADGVGVGGAVTGLDEPGAELDGAALGGAG
jgi:hypothetical protein